MKRTVEKILAWIANVILILLAGFVAFISFTGTARDILSDPTVKVQFENGIRDAVAENPALAGNVLSADEYMGLILSALKGYSIFAIILVVLAIVATLVMRKRILSGILFILVALLVTLGSFAILWFLGLAYLIVAIMLFVRKEPKNQDPFDPSNPENRIDEIKYV